MFVEGLCQELCIFLVIMGYLTEYIFVLMGGFILFYICRKFRSNLVIAFIEIFLTLGKDVFKMFLFCSSDVFMGNFVLLAVNWALLTFGFYGLSNFSVIILICDQFF